MQPGKYKLKKNPGLGAVTMADGKTKTETLHKPCDLKLPAQLYADSQPCVRKKFSTPFVPQPAGNHTYFEILSQLPLNIKHNLWAIICFSITVITLWYQSRPISILHPKALFPLSS